MTAPRHVGSSGMTFGHMTLWRSPEKYPEVVLKHGDSEIDLADNDRRLQDSLPEDVGYIP